jgi:tetratricopeptide (TPR) repeat protein
MAMADQAVDADFIHKVEILAFSGRDGDAQTLCSHRLANHPDDVTALHCLVLLHSGRGEWDRALERALKVLSLAPQHFPATLNAGLMLDRLGRIDEALPMLERAVSLDPRRVEAHSALGNALAKAGQHTRAGACFQQALNLAPSNPDCLNNLGATLLNLGRPAQAIPALRVALAAQPGHAGARMNLADALRVLDNYDEAERLYSEAIEADPDCADAYQRLGLLRADQGHMDTALTALRRAVELAPDSVNTHLSLAITLLTGGRMLEGWYEYEWRRQSQAWKKIEPPFPAWNGDPLLGHSILLWGEQGSGDVLQFLRFVPAVKAMGATVIVRVPAALKALAASLPGIDRVVTSEAEVEVADCQASLHSLPFLLNLEAQDVSGEPYLTVPEARVAGWRRVLDGVNGLKVGVCWAGNPGNRVDARRSAPVDVMALLPQVPGITYLNLQLGSRSGEFSCLGTHGLDVTDNLSDLNDTAALITLLDVVVTVDTAVAHLAGALGRPVLLMLPVAADWRWLRDRTDTPWYDSVRLIRQTIPGEWREVALEVGFDLLARIGIQRGAAKVGGPDAVAGHFTAGKLTEAEVETWRSMAVSGATAPLLSLLGAIRLKRGTPASAVPPLRLAIQAGMENAEIYGNLAIALRRLDRLDDAADAFLKALELEPDHPGTLFNYGNLLTYRGRYAEALDLYQRASDLEPERHDIRYNLGNALRDVGRIDDAEQCYLAILTDQPDNAEVRNSLGMLRLLLGRMAEGWPDYESRWQAADLVVSNHAIPMWDGLPLDGRTVLLHAEQGFGDTMQFVRYAPLMADMGGKVVLEIQPELVDLCRLLPGIDKVVARGKALPRFDCHAPLLSLPRLFGTELDSIPAEIPYLRVGPTKVKHWQAKFGRRDRLRVGLVWAGNPRHAKDNLRSITLKDLEPLAAVTGIAWFSLQVGPKRQDLEAHAGWSRGAVDLGGQIEKFSDTAAILSHLDLVITVDTAVAHLAGAMGLPAWVLLPPAPDWRWMLNREDSPWYPSLRLYRGGQAGQWDDAVGRITADLAAKVKAGKRNGT